MYIIQQYLNNIFAFFWNLICTQKSVFSKIYNIMNFLNMFLASLIIYDFITINGKHLVTKMQYILNQIKIALLSNDINFAAFLLNNKQIDANPYEPSIKQLMQVCYISCTQTHMSWSLVCMHCCCLSGTTHSAQCIMVCNAKFLEINLQARIG